MLAPAAQSDGGRRAIFDSLGRVDQKVQQDLLDLHRVDQYLRRPPVDARFELRARFLHGQVRTLGTEQRLDRGTVGNSIQPVIVASARNLGVVAFQNNVSKGQVLDAAAGLLLELVRRLP